MRGDGEGESSWGEDERDCWATGEGEGVVAAGEGEALPAAGEGEVIEGEDVGEGTGDGDGEVSVAEATRLAPALP